MAKFIANLVESVIVAGVVGMVVGLAVGGVAYVVGSEEAVIHTAMNVSYAVAGVLTWMVVGVRK